ncbi:MAG: penicillin-binding protein activator LpoB [Burkholderiales bacterium]
MSHRQAGVSAAALGAVAMAVAMTLTGCTAVPNSHGRQVVDVDPGVRGPVAGTGIEAQDITAMTDQMIRDLLSTPEISKREQAPRVVMDAARFTNESTQSINKNLIVDRLRVGLNRSGKGRLQFISREHAQAVDEERQAKRDGLTDVGTTGLVKAVAGVDYRLTGRIASTDSRNNKTGMQQRYMQITFEMLDMESSAIVWSNQYEFARAAADDVVYR